MDSVEVVKGHDRIVDDGSERRSWIGRRLETDGDRQAAGCRNRLSCAAM
jgi:hypothetical protein